MNNETKVNGGLTYIRLDELHAHPDNPRKDVGDVSELADSIKSKGIMQNLTVVPRAEGGYTVIIGHRRCAAAKMAGLETVPCAVVEMSDQEQVATMLLENMQRVDLTPYEQAAGFQMMIDFGESVDTIADKTGFSKKTVKRRLKMAELDQSILKEVSDRQISLDDFDKLSQVEDIEKRNEILKVIGTNNFNQKVQAQIRTQKIKKNMPFVLSAIKAIHGNKLHYSETYSGKYSKFEECKLSEFTKFDIPENRMKDKIYYFLEESYDVVKLFYCVPKPTPKKRSQAEIDAEKKINEAHATLEALTSEAYSLRKTFIRELKPTKDQKDEMLKGAVYACLREQYQYNSHVNKTEMYTEVSGADIDDSNYNASYRLDQILKAYKKNSKRAMVAIIYCSLENTSETSCHTTYKGEYPKYSRNRGLELLYDWLCSLGYQMSDMEKGLVHGTHPIFEGGK